MEMDFPSNKARGTGTRRGRERERGESRERKGSREFEELPPGRKEGGREGGWMGG